ncbi:phosphoribosylanthranilate isomerase [Paenibacillus sp. PL2-23]|uniref:phosphoribosylanthranilate isomerase n=1 Tax=Paenibacillus sp. PL2-23 TaxID=2100729 RepID=UPI0030FB6EFC
MSTRIKICGLRDTATIASLDGLPIHEIGFILAPSRRRVELSVLPELLDAVRRIRGSKGEPPRTVGVFVNESLEQIDSILSQAPLDVVQLHGEESPDYCRQLKEKHPAVKRWRVFSIRGGDGSAADTLLQQARERLVPYGDSADAFLIDAPGGGTGHTFHWPAIVAYKTAAAELGLPLYVAGGLNPDNVGELLQGYAPDGIDVSSGVETEGRKDIDKIRLFVRRVMEA